jgi:hypothetical protein
MANPSLIKARRGLGAAVWLSCVTLGAGGAWAVAAVTSQPPAGPPPAPTFGSKPAAATRQVWAIFSLSDARRRIYFQCSLDGAAFRDCSSPVRYGPASFAGRVRCKGQSKAVTGQQVKWCRGTVTSRSPALTIGAHTFSARAVLGTVVGPPSSYTWTITDAAAATTTPSPGPTPTPASPPASAPSAPVTPPAAGGGSAPIGEPMPFTISGNPEGLMYPGAPPRRIPLVLANANGSAIYVTAVTVTAASENPYCPVEENLVITQSNASPQAPVVIPAHGSVVLPTQGVTAPSIELTDLQAVNQDGCKGSTFILRYGGSAHS